MGERPDQPGEASRRLWIRMLETAERLDAAAPEDSRVADQLTTLEEAFDGCFDPADQFPEYVAVRLCRALRRQLE